jgi:hypothetical protein
MRYNAKKSSALSFDSSVYLAILGSLCMYVFGAATARAAAAAPSITAVTANFSTNQPTITITGINFGSITPGVTLDGVPLVVELYTSTSVTALLPASLSPGTFRLVLTDNATQLQGAFDASIGAVGPEGPAGPAGAAGPAGPAGPTGSRGPAGAKGATGPAGPAGATGAPGRAGTAGSKGPAGATGATGPQGPAGPLGLPGPTGATGAIGPAGAVGPQGLTWQGYWNNSAVYALNSAVAYNASTYISLIANNTAYQPDVTPDAWSLVASAGAAGAQGPAGATGATGPQGPAGATGAMGLVGPAGQPGVPGAAGPAGPTGPQGLTWQNAWNASQPYNLNDAVAYNGSSYISLVANNTANQPDTAPAAWSLIAGAGATGAQGAAGAGGTTGPQGPAGPQGAQGANGAIGLTGLAGPAGPQGPQGSQGPQGVAGASGATGPQGQPGSTLNYYALSSGPVQIYSDGTTVATLFLNAGQYWISSTTAVQIQNGQGASISVFCQLVSSSGSLASAPVVTDMNNSGQVTLATQGVANFTTSVYVYLQCTANTSGVTASNSQITAISVANVNSN